MRKKNTIYLDGTIVYPTSDGQSINFVLNEDEYGFEYEFELGFYYRDTSGDLPTDVLEHRIWVSDSQGKVWTATTRFTTEVLVQHIYNFADIYAPYPFEQMEESSQQLFAKNLILSDIHYGNDDRIYRQLVLDDEIITVKFHYTVMTFDLAVIEDAFLKSTGKTKSALMLRLREGSLYDDNYDPVPTIKFEINPAVLFKYNTAVYDPNEEFWSDSELPLPIVFEPTNEQSEFSQSNVIVN